MIYDIREFEITLEKMRTMEAEAGDYYAKCASVFGEQYDFWHKIADEEYNHRDILKRLIGIVKLNPEKFSWNMPVQMKVINTLLESVRTNTDRLGTGKLTLKEALNFAVTIEDTMTETSYDEIIITDDEEINTIINEITEETADHKNRIIEMTEKFNQEK